MKIKSVGAAVPTEGIKSISKAQKVIHSDTQVEVDDFFVFVKKALSAEKFHFF
ncbi:hypothetical protein QS257_20475 [Terrilactibacillus sp. S3-3]|nr:hypothetical protein QS257_20475 [Terrilactibacillus sp. S3-3]